MDTQQLKHSESERNQFRLMTTRRFVPFFWTQFFGAFNDNVYKNVFIISIAFQSIRTFSVNSDVIVNIAAGLFILPFFLFSAPAGQIADKYEKSALIRRIKILEIIIMVCAAVAFLFSHITALLILLFFMGVQSTFFGPVKYSIIPQHLKPGEIVGGNAMVEMGTFLAILLGTLGGGLLSQLNRPYVTGIVIITMALSGWFASRYIPPANPNAPELKIRWNLLTQTWETIKFSKKNHSVFLSILAVSWFWFLGAAYLTQLPNYTKTTLKGSEIIVTLLLTTFSVGIGTGSLMCEKMSGKKVELGLVPLGAIGLSIFGIDLFFAYSTPEIIGLMSLSHFFQTPGSLRVITDLLLIGIFGGFYIVPLYSFIQIRTMPECRARIIAANNILNALLMVVAAALGAVLIGVFKFTALEFFLVIAILNVIVSIYIFSVVPEFAMRFLIWIISHTIYRVRHINLHNIPDQGPAVLVCNHVSYVDGPIIGGSCRRPIRFVIFETFYRMPVLNFIFRTGKAIPISSHKRNPNAYKNAFDQIALALNEGELVCIFPEGKLTEDGKVHEFKRGIEKIVKRNPVPVIPVALRGLWGSFFSHKGGRALKQLPKRFWSKIELIAGEPIKPEHITANRLREIVINLLEDDG